MRKVIIFLLSMSAILLFASCNSENATTNSKDQTLTARSLVESNAYIDVKDYGAEISDEVRENPERKALVRAALYRFYSHVKIVDDQYTCDLTSADEINISPAMFKFMVDDIKKSNEYILNSKAKGHIPIIAPVDDDYLNSLLDERPLIDRMYDEAKARSRK